MLTKNQFKARNGFHVTASSEFNHFNTLVQKSAKVLSMSHKHRLRMSSPSHKQYENQEMVTDLQSLHKPKLTISSKSYFKKKKISPT